MQDAVVNLTRIRMIETLATDEPMARVGNRVWGAPSSVYPCHPEGVDDYVTIYIGGDAWDSLLAVMGRADLIGDERYATAEARSERQDEVEAIISAWTSTKRKHDVMADLTELGIPCGAVLDTREVLDDPQLKAREMVVEVNDPNRGTYPAFGCPIKISSNSICVRPPPLLGEHSAEVLSSILDFDAEQLASLEDGGVI